VANEEDKAGVPRRPGAARCVHVTHRQDGGRRVGVIGALVAAVAVVGNVARGADGAATRPVAATRSAAAAGQANVPEAAVGAWYSGTGTPAVYSDTKWEDRMGRAGDTGTTFVIRADGTYELFVFVDMRSSGFVTQVRTRSGGRIAFAGDRYTVTPTAGQRWARISGKVTDRPLNEAELKEMARTYRWRIDRDTTKEGHRYFVVPLDDGSEQRFRVVREGER
jgi:hypothetical protein